MSSRQQTLVRIYHPMFRKGYYDGRQNYFRDSVVFTDKELVESLEYVFFGEFPEIGQEEPRERKKCLYYGIGQLVGKMSVCVIPCQPHEYKMQEIQEEFLLKVKQEYGTSMVDAIRQFWARQDRLAQKLDADTFECIINRGISPLGSV